MKKTIPKLNFDKESYKDFFEEVEIEEAVNLKKLRKEYDKNEDKNYHTENYLLLAKAFGTPAEVKKVEEILKRNKKQGSTSAEDSDWMYKNINKYFDKIRKEEVEEEKQFSAFDKIRGIRKKLNEGLDRHAIQELKLYIENDRDLYRQQIVPIIKSIQRRMKKGTYDHLKAPKLWMYLVDNGAKKYVKEFGGDVKSQFPKDVRHSVAVEFANEYRAEIEAQGGEML